MVNKCGYKKKTQSSFYLFTHFFKLWGESHQFASGNLEDLEMIFSQFMHQNMGPLPTRKINSWLKGTETKTRKHTYIDFQMQVGKCLFAPFISLSIIVLLTGMLKSSNLSKNSRAIFHDNIINKLSNANNIFVSLCFTNLKGLDISARIKVYLHHLSQPHDKNLSWVLES